MRITPASGATIGLLFSAAFGFALVQIRIGFGPGFDEGFYLATPLRYALGDVPFRDEFFNPLRMFDVVLTPVFRAFPDLSLHALRLGWVAFQLAATLALAALFSRFAPPALVALACASSIWIPNLIWSPGYHVMGTTFFILGSSLWLLACLHRSRRAAIPLAAASGGAFFVGVVCYAPLVAVAVVPAAVLLHELARGDGAGSRRLATLVHLGTFALLLGVGAAAVGLAGLSTDWLDATATINSLGYYKITPSRKLVTFARQLTPYLPIAFAGATIAVALVIASRSARTSRLGAPATAAIGVALLAILYGLFFGLALPPMGRLMGDELTRPFRIVVLLLGLALGIAAMAKRHREDPANPDWRLVSGCVLSGSLILALLHGVLSSMAFKAMFAAPPLAVCVTVALYRALTGQSPDTAQRRLATVAVTAIGLAVASVAVHTRSADSAPGERRAFSHPRLAGIVASPSEVDRLEGLLEQLSGRVRAGDFLLAYDDLPLLYFLTGTRPAIDHAWTSRVIPNELRARSLRRMIAANRIPGVAVRSLHPFSVGYVNAIHHFVRQHYELAVELPGYEIWVLRDEHAAPRATR